MVKNIAYDLSLNKFTVDLVINTEGIESVGSATSL